MAHDVVIRGGRIADGTGAPLRTADVAIDGGIITEVGTVGRGRREVDADGALVTPGFVDIHTHYDGQVTWAQRFQPSSAHGVTTVVMGNCGVGFAPCRPEHRSILVELMEGVEDIPGSVLSEGLPWTWQTFGEYLDAIEQLPHDLDFATQVCHAPLRVWVMGQRGADREPATPAEIAAMGRIAADAVAAGALGFSTSRTINHKTKRGALAATIGAARDELVGIARAVASTGTGMLQMVSDLDDLDDEFATMRAMMRASGLPLLLSIGQRFPGDAYRRELAAIAEANAQGLRMTGVVATRAIGVIVTIDGSVNPWAASPTFTAARAAGDDLRDATIRRQVIAETVQAGGVRYPLDRTFPLAEHPDYEPTPEMAVAARAAQEGRDPVEVLYDVLLEGPAYYAAINYHEGDLDAVAFQLSHPNTVPGLGDGGAHVSMIADASFPTTLLQHWGRDRTRGEQFDVAWLVSRQTRATAAAVGLLDRGLLSPGHRADINVIDFDRLRVRRPRIVPDLPAGGQRLLQEAEGYVHTFVAGVETYAEGVATGALPGRLVRGFRPSPR